MYRGSGDGRSITWSSFNKPTNITKGNASALFQYGPDRARYQQTSTDGSTSSTITYVGSLLEIEQQGALEIHRQYVQANGETVAIFTERNNSTSDTRYLHRDHLGSVDTITDETGSIVEKQSFDAFGHARLSNWSALSVFSSNVLRRGFTGHEMLEGVGLIHMNGRVYDPTIGRFLSADPFVQAPKNLQNLNRYSYVINNPLSYTDPSGFIFGKIKKAIKKVAKAVTSAVRSVVSSIASIQGSVLNFINGNPITGTIANAIACSAGPYACAAYAAASSYAATGDFGAGIKAGAIAFGTAYSAEFIKTSGRFPTLESKVVAHGVVGGAAAEAQGGKFGQGFAASAVGKLGSGVIADKIGSKTFNQRVSGAIAAATLAGTTSALSGGKFLNGARTVAIQYLYNEVSAITAHERVKTSETVLNDETHVYTIEGLICDGGPQCNAELADRVYAYVNNNDIPFTTDDLRQGVHILTSPFSDSYDPIEHRQFPSLRMSVNLTIEGHRFHYGTVTHSIHFKGSALYYTVTGAGDGGNPLFNNRAGRVLFTPGVRSAVRRFGF